MDTQQQKGTMVLYHMSEPSWATFILGGALLFIMFFTVLDSFLSDVSGLEESLVHVLRHSMSYFTYTRHDQKYSKCLHF